MSTRKKLNQREFWDYFLVEESEDISDDFSASDSDDDCEDAEYHLPRIKDDSQLAGDITNSPENRTEQSLINNCIWEKIDRDVTFEPKYKMPVEKEAEVLIDIPDDISELDVFLKIFPKSLYKRIAECTNQRLQILNSVKSEKCALTDDHEIMLVLGIALVMHYNQLPSIGDYWSKSLSVGNDMIKRSISRHRFCLLMSNMYFNDCNKPDNAAKDYYVSEVVSCVKNTFPSARSESSIQSIGVVFMDRSCLEQYMSLGTIKRGLWLRRDAKTGYTYDLYVNTAGKTSRYVNDALGKQIVEKLTAGIRERNVVFTFDRFFTSMNLINTIPFPSFGTYKRTVEEAPVFHGRLQPSESQFQINSGGVMAARWMDSKEVLVVSNCHMPTVIKVSRKQKNASKLEVDCPLAIADYKGIMKGVNVADQKAVINDMNRTSKKWWKQAFFKIFMLAIINAWVIFAQSQRHKTPIIEFIVPLAESMINKGIEHRKVKTCQCGGRPTKPSRAENGSMNDNLPFE